MAIKIKTIGGGLTENNVSVQVRDEAWFVFVKNTQSKKIVGNTISLSTTHSTGVLGTQPSGDPIKIGTITEVGPGSVTVETPINIPPINSFLMFKKSSVANDTSLLGYYAEVELSNNSTEKAELFALNSEITASSK